MYSECIFLCLLQAAKSQQRAKFLAEVLPITPYVPTKKYFGLISLSLLSAKKWNKMMQHIFGACLRISVIPHGTYWREDYLRTRKLIDVFSFAVKNLQRHRASPVKPMRAPGLALPCGRNNHATFEEFSNNYFLRAMAAFFSCTFFFCICAPTEFLLLFSIMPSPYS